MRRLSLAALFACTAACGGGALDGVDTTSQIKPDPLAVGSWDLDRARPDPAGVLPFACETAADKVSWPCIAGAITDTVVGGIVLLDASGAYGVVINHRVKLAGTTMVVDRLIDEEGIENAGGVRTGAWGRSSNRIVLYPASFTSTTRYADLSDSAFVHGLTTMTLRGARFVLR